MTKGHHIKSCLVAKLAQNASSSCSSSGNSRQDWACYVTHSSDIATNNVDMYSERIASAVHLAFRRVLDFDESDLTNKFDSVYTASVFEGNSST